MTMRDQRRVREGIAAAALLSGAPSTLISWRRHGALGPVVGDLLRATRAAGTLLPPGEAGLLRGAVAHCVVSLAYGELLARALPQRRSALWGAGAGLGLGAVNLLGFGRRYPAIRALPLIPQLADNVAFGVIFALVADRWASVTASAWKGSGQILRLWCESGRRSGSLV
jgi:hypothetical protein